jgi:hypothetical protein
MTIITTLSEVFEKCSDWEFFCEEEGWATFCIKEGGGDIAIHLTEEQAIKYGLICSNI